MKQSNNAIKYLMAQYRAIFKHAYFKGIASATLFSAALAGGAAQAADQAYYWDSSKWTELTTYSSSITTKVTGAYADALVSGVVSGGILVLGSDGQKVETHKALAGTIGDTNGKAFGGYSSMTDKDAQATNNKLYVTSGGGLSGGAYLIGGYAFSKQKTATSSNNLLDLTLFTGSYASGTITTGGWAEAKTGATADNNNFILKASGDNPNKVQAEAHGGIVYTAKDSTSGTFVASNNTLDATGVTFAKTESGASFITGGTASYKPGDSSTTENSIKLQALNNQVKLDSVKVGTDSDNKLNNLIGNYAFGLSGSIVTASGDSSKLSVDIKNSTIYFTNVYGGIAKTASGGNATADGNSISIKDTKILAAGNETNMIIGGRVYTEQKASANNTLSASNNSVVISSSKNNDATDKFEVNGSIMGGYVSFSGTSSFEGLTVTANGNKIEIGKGVLVKLNGTNFGEGIYGANVNTIDTNGIVNASGAKFTSSGNSVLIEGIVSGSNTTNSEQTPVGIFAALSNSGDALMLNNDVTIKGQVKDVAYIAGGMGADSLVSLEKDSKVQFTNIDGAINSDKVKLAGDLEIGTSKTLKIAGFFHNGNYRYDGKAPYYTNETTIESSAKILNYGTLELLGDTTVQSGAGLYAMADGASLKINGGGKADNYSVIYDKYDETKDLLKEAEMVGGRGALHISSEALGNYLKGGITVDKTTTSKKGTVAVTSGGVLDFGQDEVVLSNFSFDTTGTPAGSILVDANDTNAGSVFKAKTLTVEKALTKADGADLGTNGVILEADKLVLGSSSLSEADSKKILFAKARVKDEMDFRADGEFQLTSDVSGSTFKQIFQQSGNEKEDLVYFEALDGKILGDVNLTSDNTNSGSITINDGNWTADGSIRVSSSGSLTIGGTSEANDLIEQGTTIKSRPDATLSANGGLILDVSKNGTGTITVSGEDTARFDYDSALDTEGDDRFTMLDLTTGGLTLAGDSTASNKINGVAEVNVTSGGVIRVKAEDLNEILKQNNDTTINANNQSGAFFKADTGGAYEVSGDLETKFTDFNKNGGSPAHNGFVLDSDGYLFADSLSIINEHSGTEQDDSTYTAQKANLNGYVIVDSLTITDQQQTTGTGKPSGAGNLASKVVLANGKVEIGQSLTSENHTLVLGDGTSDKVDMTFATDTAEGAGTISVANIELTNSSTIAVENGSWKADKTIFNLSGTGSLTVGGTDSEKSANLVAQGFVLGSGTLNVADTGKASFGSFDIGTGGASKITVTGELTINGNPEHLGSDGVTKDPKLGLNFSGTDGTIEIGNNGILQFSTDATHAAILKSGAYTSGSTITLIDNFAKISNQGGELHLGFTNETSFDEAAIKALKDALFTTGSFDGNHILKDGGILNIGDAKFDYLNDKLEVNNDPGCSGYKVAWDKISDFNDIYGTDVANNDTNQTNVYGITYGDQIKGNWGSLSVATGNSVEIGGNTTLSFAEGNNNKFVSTADHSKAVDAVIKSQKSLTLVNGGEIGKVTLETSNSDLEKNITKFVVKGGGVTNIASIDTTTGVGGPSSKNNTYVAIEGQAVVGSIKNVGYLDSTGNGDLLVETDAYVHEISTTSGKITVNKKLTIDQAYLIGGLIDVKEEAILKNNGSGDQAIEIANGGEFIAKSLVLDNSKQGSNAKFIRVGTDDYKDLPENTNGTGYLSVQNLELNGGTLVVDPSYSDKTSVSSVLKFVEQGKQSQAGQNGIKNDVGMINGRIWVGNNAVQSIGATKDEALAAIEQYQSNGALKSNEIGSIIYLNGQLTVAAGSEIALNTYDSSKPTDVAIRESLKYRLPDQINDQYASLGLGANTAILLTEKAFEDNKGERTGTAIHFEKTNASVNAQGGSIILAGDFDAASKLNIFSDADGQGKEGVDIQSGEIEVRTQNGFLHSILKGENQGYGVTLEVDKSRAALIMNGASQPVLDSLIEYHDGRINGTITGSNDFLNEVTSSTNGAPAESVARLAVYGGAVQAAVAANNATTDLLSARMGIGALDAPTMANNGQGGTLWVSPIYKSQDASGFAADNFKYGVDVNLYGLALGGDYTLGNGFSFGAMFNVGQGDSDGKGNTAAEGTSNDFDYYGFALYGGYSYGNFAVSADLGYSMVNSDIESTVDMKSLNKVKASTDTSALTLGLTGKYTFDLNGMEVEPHAGVRFTRFDLDNCSVDGIGEVAHFSGDTLNVFSVPVGVAIAKEYQGEEWTIKPSLDLTLTGNFGDDEIQGDVTWTGVDGLKTHTKSEFMDSFTYGVSLGLSAQTETTSFGVGVNYTGSSNVDEYGVSANFRFLF